MPPYNVPCFPNGSGASWAAVVGQKLASGSASQSNAGAAGDDMDASPHNNPVIAFDTRNVGITELYGA